MKADFSLALKYAVLASVVIWGACAALDVGGQRELFYNEGRELLSDYWMPRTCLDEGYAEVGDEFPVAFGRRQSGWENGKMRVLAVDRCYPAFALMLLKPFPASWGGAWAWTVVSTLVLVGVLCGISRSWWAVVLLGASPVLFNLERGNQIAMAAALVGVFLAWYRSEMRWKRIVAALAISAATCLKVCPVVLGALYLREKDWKGIGLCVAFTSAMFFIPWFFVPDGFSNLPQMLEHARANGEEYARTAEFGLLGLWRTMRVASHMNCVQLWPGAMVVSCVSQVLGLAMVAWGAWKRNLLWAAVGMLWAAGNMHYYGALYLLPILALGHRCVNLLSAVLWFVILCPLQLVISHHGANGPLCNLAAMGLLLTQRNEGEE